MSSDRDYNSERGGGAGWRGGGRRRPRSYQDQGDSGRGRGGARRGGRGNYQDQGGRGRGNDQNQPSQGRGRGWAAPPRGYSSTSPDQPSPRRQRASSFSTQNPQFDQFAPSSSKPPVQSPTLQAAHQPSADQLDKPPSTLSLSEDKIQPIRRPDRGGSLNTRRIQLDVNHFLVRFDKERTMIHYNVDVKFLPSDNEAPMERTMRKSENRFIRDLLFKDQEFPDGALKKTTYDGGKNIFSAIELPEREFRVVISKGEDVRSGIYIVTIKHVSELKSSKLDDYFKGNLPDIPRDILQGMDLVMKENPLEKRIPLGRSFFSLRHKSRLSKGLVAYEGFNQSLKPTLQGLSLCLDYSVQAFPRPLPVFDFLKEHISEFREENDVKMLRSSVEKALKGLLVRVNHRQTNQKYTIAGLAPEDASECYFEWKNASRSGNTSLIQYFKERWEKDVMHPNLPCLELGKNNKSNKVPIEFCVLVAEQRFPKDNEEDGLKILIPAHPMCRMQAINKMVRADDGPSGDIARNFGIKVNEKMTNVRGRVMLPPILNLGAPKSVKVDALKCQWNLVGKSFVDSKSLDRWALIDFTDGDRFKFQKDAFVNKLIDRCRNLGIQMAKPLVYWPTRDPSVQRLETLLKDVVEEAGRINEEKLQMIVCVMRSKTDRQYKNLKWVSETQIGVVTQCCFQGSANKGDQYLANLCLKINAKLGGSNFELKGKLLHFDAQEHVMFIGADVNHPSPRNRTCPSIAAVVGTVNWPAANRYAARIRPQEHRCEEMQDFGAMCLELVETYGRLNMVRPKRIIVFRDGVSEGQFEMVLNKELVDLRRAIYRNDYQPRITVIVAQKRHQTRLFVGNRSDGGESGNVPPGTVVDTTIVHPRDFDFYLCSHYGGLGTSKPTHYYVLWDENSLSSDDLQKLIFDMCFTYVRCTKSVSLVPPVKYADRVASRGRMYQEAAMQNERETNYRLHPDLENTMFFI